MARKSKAQIEAELEARQAEIDSKVEERVKAMLPSLVASMTTEITAKVMQAGGGSGGMGADMQGFIRNMAVDMAKIADPRNERKTVSPEVAASREEGRQKLMTLLSEAAVAVDKGEEAPIYVLINKCFLGGVKFEPQQENATTHRMEDVEINWLRIPNQSMRPVCVRAKAIHAAYLQSISNGIGQLGSPPPGSWVITGNKIRRRGMFADEPPATGGIRREDPAMRQRKTVPVLGTLAEPVVETI
jgi:hypothetical protein